MEFREQRPALVRCRAFHGAVHSAGGPFLASGGWWDEHGWAQEQWDIQMSDGRLCRVTRREDGCFVEGVYD